jgi:7-cyano-7-deazaguanine synthase in queuosine biosynthesis
MVVKSKKVVLLFTPGLDSFLANSILEDRLEHGPLINCDFNRVYFDLGSKYSDKERTFLLDHYPEGYVDIDQSLDLSTLEDATSYHVPYRNNILVTMAAAKYNADYVYLNGVLDDNVSDNTEKFRKNMTKTLSDVAGKKVIVDSVLGTSEKSFLVKDYVNKHGSPLTLLTYTYSCFEFNNDRLKYNVPIFTGKDNSFQFIREYKYDGCLTCSACFRKICALTYANIFIPFNNKLMIKQYKNKLNTPYFDRTPNRKTSIINYLKFEEFISNAKKY